MASELKLKLAAVASWVRKAAGAEQKVALFRQTAANVRHQTTLRMIKVLILCLNYPQNAGFLALYFVFLDKNFPTD